MYLSLSDRKLSFDAYYGFTARRLDVKVSLEDSDMMPFMAMCDLCDWKYCDVKLYGDIVLIMVRIIIIE